MLTSGALGRTYPPPHHHHTHQQQDNGSSAQPGRGTRSSGVTPSTDLPQQALLPQHASSAAAAWLDSDDTSLQSLQEPLPAQAPAPAVVLQPRGQRREEGRPVQQAAGVCEYGSVHAASLDHGALMQPQCSRELQAKHGMYRRCRCTHYPQD
jgi:hypothetical protein